MLNRSASLAMSTSVLKALPGKLDIKRHSPSILYIKILRFQWLYCSTNNSGRWATEGCHVKHVTTDTVTCSCNHVTNFAILMSPSRTVGYINCVNIFEQDQNILALIT